MAIRKKPITRKPTRRRPSSKSGRPRTFWDDLADIGRRVPKEELAALPRDAAKRFDDYFDSPFESPLAPR